MPDDPIKVFEDTGVALLLKSSILTICEEQHSQGVDRYVIATALMGAALDQIDSRDGMVGQLVFLRDTADQIEAALERASTKPV